MSLHADMQGRTRARPRLQTQSCDTLRHACHSDCFQVMSYLWQESTDERVHADAQSRHVRWNGQLMLSESSRHPASRLALNLAFFLTSQLLLLYFGAFESALGSDLTFFSLRPRLAGASRAGASDGIGLGDMNVVEVYECVAVQVERKLPQAAATGASAVAKSDRA